MSVELKVGLGESRVADSYLLANSVHDSHDRRPENCTEYDLAPPLDAEQRIANNAINPENDEGIDSQQREDSPS